jgi:lipoprotein-releasing system ATP-binding protein
MPEQGRSEGLEDSAAERRGVVLRARGLSKTYPGLRAGGAGVALFRELSLEVAAGESVAIVGQSGAGKSSLLHLLAGLDTPSAGEIWLGETELGRLSSNEAAQVRNQRIGFVWQFHYLLPEFSAAENVAMPLLARGVARRQALEQARLWLGRVELAARAEHRPGELSGGEQQRVAIARALVTRPSVLLADEPTGDLDDATAAHLFGLLERLCREERLAVVVVTHNLEIARRCDRVLRLSEGRLLPDALLPGATEG